MLFTYQQATAQLNIQNKTIEWNVFLKAFELQLVFASKMIVCVQTAQALCNV